MVKLIIWMGFETCFIEEKYLNNDFCAIFFLHTSRRQLAESAYFDVTQDKTTLHPRTPLSILSYKESPPPICIMSNQQLYPCAVRVWYNFLICGCLPHWYDMKMSGDSTEASYKWCTYCMVTYRLGPSRTHLKKSCYY